MNGRTAKKLRRAVAARGLPESQLMRSVKTGEVIRGQGEREVYLTMKKFRKDIAAGVSHAQAIQKLQQRAARVRG